jgi:hypothetical protein
MGNQQQRLLQYLKQQVTITPMQAWTMLGIYRLADTVYKLRGKGFVIDTDRIDVTNQFGEDCNVARYIYKGELQREG